MVVADDPSWEVKNAKKVVRKYETGNSGSDEEECKSQSVSFY